MALEVYTFSKHTLAVKYPESSANTKFGRGYSFASKPKGPDQIEYTLNYDGMWFFFTNPTTYDLIKHPSINMRLLEQFYHRHRMYEPFTYPHDTEGNLTVRFAAPLEYNILKGGNGQVEPFSVKLILLP